MAPAFTLKNLNGKPVSLADFKGKVVILDFWATWCPPCREELPNFIEIQKEFKDRGVTVVGLSVDSIQPSEVAKFAAQNGINYPILMADPDTAQAFGVQGFPTTFVVGRNGEILQGYEGAESKETFVAEIEKALAEKK